MTSRLFLNYIEADQQIAKHIKRDLLAAGFAVDPEDSSPVVTGASWAPALSDDVIHADAMVVLFSPNLLKSAASVRLIIKAVDHSKLIFSLYTGSLSLLQIALPDELQVLVGRTWYDAADSASWLSALLSEAADDFADSRDTTRGIPDHLWELESSDGEPPAAASTPISNAANDPRPPKPKPQWQQTEPPAGGQEAESAPSEPILFSSYTPKEAAPNIWLSLYGYVYKQSAAPQVSIDVGVLLGDKAGDFRELEQPAIAPVEAGALITATPNLPGFQFNPPSASIILLEDWHRFDFKLRATTAPVNQAANGSITFSVEGVIVADIPISIFVSPQAQSRSSGAPSGRLSPGVSPYRAVFCSYSHKDTAIVERVERAIKLLGYTYLRDATTLRSGENWNDALMKMIDQADIFQLFWSSNSSKSKYVQQEWEYALKNKGTKANFIRPVYWEEPLPSVPDALGMLHFEYEPTLDDV